MGYRSDILQATLGLWGAVMGAGRVPADLKYMAGYLASMAAGCQYCSAHTASNAAHSVAAVEKIAAIWDYERSDLFSQAERAALNFALLAGQSPSGVTDEAMSQLAAHFDEEQIVELLAVSRCTDFSTDGTTAWPPHSKRRQGVSAKPTWQDRAGKLAIMPLPPETNLQAASIRRD